MECCFEGCVEVVLRWFERDIVLSVVLRLFEWMF